MPGSRTGPATAAANVEKLRADLQAAVDEVQRLQAQGSNLFSQMPLQPVIWEDGDRG
jgi:hypothetical protein